MQYEMFLVMKAIRGLDPKPLAQKLFDTLAKEKKETFAGDVRLRVNQQNRDALHRILARLTDYVETQSGQPSPYVDFVSGRKTRYEVEHIWADHPERHTAEFSDPADFYQYRDRIGGLRLLPTTTDPNIPDTPLTV